MRNKEGSFLADNCKIVVFVYKQVAKAQISTGNAKHLKSTHTYTCHTPMTPRKGLGRTSAGIAADITPGGAAIPTAESRSAGSEPVAVAPPPELEANRARPWSARGSISESFGLLQKLGTFRITSHEVRVEEG